jgi:hypothetical protein
MGAGQQQHGWCRGRTWWEERARLLRKGKGVAQQHVHLVQHDGPALLQLEAAGPNKLRQAPRGCNREVNALLQRVALRTQPEAACAQAPQQQK